MKRSTEGITIIMVEDDEGHARLIEKNLRRAGIANEIIHYITGQSVIDHFFKDASPTDNHERTLILLDLNLPQMDGYDVLKILKTDHRTRSIPIVVLTTTEHPKEIDRCYELGCNVYITKPVEYESFCDAIRKLGLMLAVVKIPQY